MSTTIGDIADQIAEHLGRNDQLAFTTKAVWNVYQQICARIPFNELQATSAPITVPTLAPSLNYEAAGVTDLAGIYSITLTDGSIIARIYKAKGGVRDFDAINRMITGGRPARYARWGAKTIEFDKIGNGTAQVTLRYWQRPQAHTDGVEKTILVTPANWDELFFWEGLYRVLYKLQRIEEAQTLMTGRMIPSAPEMRKNYIGTVGIIPRLWNDVLLTVDQQEGPDDNYGIMPRAGLL